MSSKQMVIAALAELRSGRSPANGNRAIRRILNQFGATSINDLREEHYAAVIAAVTIPTLADHYGVMTDVPVTEKRNSAPAPTPRIKSPMTLDLEQRLAERAGKPRSKPNYVVAPAPTYPQEKRS